MNKIYVCSPVRGDQNDPHVIEENLARAVMYCRVVYNEGQLPICPQIYLEAATGLNEAKDPSCRPAALKLGLEMLFLCDQIWVFGRRFGQCSDGMNKEIELARKRGMPVVYRTDYLPKL